MDEEKYLTLALDAKSEEYRELLGFLSEKSLIVFLDRKYYNVDTNSINGGI